VLRLRAARSRRLAAALYFLDSGGYDALGIGHYDWIAHDQIAWYRRVSALLGRCGPALNSGFFAALVEAGDVMGAFCGHDHVNDYEGELHGVRLAYGRVTGFAEYGREGFPRGARVIRLYEGRRRFDTWMRLEGGRRWDPPVHQPEAGSNP